jgi:PDZ domain-containing protein
VRRGVLVAAPALALAACLYVVELPVFVVGPGPAREVVPLIDIDGRTTYQPDGRLLLTTVNVGRVNTYDAVAAWLDPTYEVFSERAIIPRGQTDSEYQRVSLSQMDASKVAAVAVALDEYTEYPREHRPGVIIQATVPGTPAHGVLFPGDLVTAVGGRRLAGLDAFIAIIEEAGPGGVLRLEVRPVEGGDSRSVRISPVVRAGRAEPIIGVQAVENFPFDVRIESGTIGGPSAGLMWALGVADLLSPEDLTGGRSVAGTGDVLLDGQVAPIGGIGLKIVAADRDGADLFLVPEANMAEAEEAEADIELVPVGTMKDALRFLERES